MDGQGKATAGADRGAVAGDGGPAIASVDGGMRFGRPSTGRGARPGLPGFRFHDLRHTDQTPAAVTGATIKDLLRRRGHASPAAPYRYLHALMAATAR